MALWLLPSKSQLHDHDHDSNCIELECRGGRQQLDESSSEVLQHGLVPGLVPGKRSSGQRTVRDHTHVPQIEGCASLHTVVSIDKFSVVEVHMISSLPSFSFPVARQVVLAPHDNGCKCSSLHKEQAVFLLARPNIIRRKAFVDPR